MAADTVYSQVHRRMVESGEWDKVYATLVIKLNELGWIDDLKHTAKERARSMSPVHFQSLLAQLDEQGQASIPLSVKQEVTATIKGFLDKQFE